MEDEDKQGSVAEIGVGNVEFIDGVRVWDISRIDWERVQRLEQIKRYIGFSFKRKGKEKEKRERKEKRK